MLLHFLLIIQFRVKVQSFTNNKSEVKNNENKSIINETRTEYHNLL